MLVSLNWLKEFVDIGMPASELADHLTMAGLEVEAVSEVAPPFTNVVVAKILSLKPHPETDKYYFCDVAAGEETYPIVCGARNIRMGDIVPLAKIGATLPGGYTIRSTKIRSVASHGMLCSEQELGIGDDASGIMILGNDLNIGQDLGEALNLRDTVLDVGITPNRSDCLSMIGIAREIAAIAGAALRYPDVSVSENDTDIKSITSVAILDPDLCPRYSARIIKDVAIKPSPLWMRRRLEAVGLRAINNIVDVTNYVMMELGQPLHAFDYRFLEEGRIVVRRSRGGETFTSLDEKERLLETDTLMICDGKKPVAIGGIMGGLNSEVKEDTGTILLESAYFTPSSIRKSAKALGMSTDAAFRFSRGIDPEGVIKALNRAARIMAEVSGGNVCKGYIDEYPKKVVSSENMGLRTARVNHVLGINISSPEIVKILESLGMTVRAEKDGVFKVTSPTYRTDIIREIDLIEEVARLYGYDRIPETLPPVSVTPVVKDRQEIVTGRIREIIRGSGFSEIITYSFISPDSTKRLGISPDDDRSKTVRIRNPLTEDQAVMRTTLVYSLLDTMKTNAHSGSLDLRMFEVGRVFIHEKKGELPTEKNMIGCLITGKRYDDMWSQGLDADFFDMKGCVENIFDGLKIREIEFRSDYRETFLHPGRCCGIYAQGRFMGFLGEVHPDTMLSFDLKSRACVAELDVDVIGSIFSDEILSRELPRFPSVVRDVAFLISDDVEAANVLKLALEMDKELLEKVNVFDVYSGKSIPGGKKSLGIRFVYRASNRTLKDDEVNELHGKLVRKIVDVTGARIRGEET
ncbi:MAG TPA: phenylalanine--tRNA ligase subunit beta [Syntrophales bacterium]|nr:phenylalanine--tRNA ligase subunit beta [Syntrophales bacterium]